MMKLKNRKFGIQPTGTNLVVQKTNVPGLDLKHNPLSDAAFYIGLVVATGPEAKIDGKFLPPNVWVLYKAYNKEEQETMVLRYCSRDFILISSEQIYAIISEQQVSEDERK